MKKFEIEREILEKSKEILKKIYGKFEVDYQQKDSPDAAILIKSKENIDLKIGIEITCIDNGNDLRYQNDEKFSSNYTSKINTKEPTLIKKQSITIDENYICKGALKKKEKYQKYKHSGNFKEIIIIIYSEFLTYENISQYHYTVKQAKHILHREKFPFDKVIFTNKENGKSELIYDKKEPTPRNPKITEHDIKKKIVSRTFIPVGEVVNLKDILKDNPIFKKK